MQRIVLASAALVCVPTVLASCGARPDPRSTTPVAPVATGPEATGLDAKAATQREVEHLLARAPLPDGARDATAAEAKGKPWQSMPAEDDHLVTMHHVYVVPLGLDDATSWFTAHPPVGVTSSGTSSAYGSDGVASHGIEFELPRARLYSAVEQQVGVFPLDDAHSVVRIDVEADWLVLRSLAEHVPRGGDRGGRRESHPEPVHDTPLPADRSSPPPARARAQPPATRRDLRNRQLPDGHRRP